MKPINPILKKILGILLILVGFFALVTPFTPGSWLAFVGLELLGVRVAFWDQIKRRFIKSDKPASYPSPGAVAPPSPARGEGKKDN